MFAECDKHKAVFTDLSLKQALKLPQGFPAAALFWLVHILSKNQPHSRHIHGVEPDFALQDAFSACFAVEVFLIECYNLKRNNT